MGLDVRNNLRNPRPETHLNYLVEKHIDFIKLTMAELQAEAVTWGFEIEGEELASEASMAANTTHEVGGYAPTTMLFGVLPRGYLVLHHGDAVSHDESAFERSVRLRQVALLSQPGLPRPTVLDLNNCQSLT